MTRTTNAQCLFPQRSPTPPPLSDAPLKSSPSEGASLWSLVPSTLHAAYLAGETGLSHIAVITWVTSLHGWGMVLPCWDNKDGKVIIGTLPATEDKPHQARREALAGVLSLEAASRLADIPGAVVTLRNDSDTKLAAECGWTLTFDAFALESNSLLHRSCPLRRTPC